jgi:hypothetical protein
LRPPSGGPEHGLDEIDRFLGPTIGGDHWTILAVVWPGVDPAAGNVAPYVEPALSAWEPHEGPGLSVRCRTHRSAHGTPVTWFGPAVWPVCGPLPGRSAGAQVHCQAAMPTQ